MRLHIRSPPLEEKKRRESAGGGKVDNSSKIWIYHRVGMIRVLSPDTVVYSDDTALKHSAARKRVRSGRAPDTANRHLF